MEFATSSARNCLQGCRTISYDRPVDGAVYAIRRLYANYQHEIDECDAEIERLVGNFSPRVDPQVKPLPVDQKKNRNYDKKRKKRDRRQPGARSFDLRAEVYKLFGVDIT